MNKDKHTRKYLEKIKNINDKIEIGQVVSVIKVLEKNLKRGKTIFICGNGGSAATASHIVSNLGKFIAGERPNSSRKVFRIICLNDNLPLLTAIGNDWSYELIFSQPLKALAKKGDLLWVITGSGNSKNIVEAVKTAQKLGLEVLAFVGFDGGLVKKLANYSLHVPSYEYGPVEDFHLIISHLIMTYFCEKF